jgi:hypothetical protein
MKDSKEIQEFYLHFLQCNGNCNNNFCFLAVTNGNELPFLAHRYTLLWRSELPLIEKIFLLFWTKNYALGPKCKLNIKNFKNCMGFFYVVLTFSIVYIKI